MMSFFVAMALTVLIGMFAGVLFYQIIMRLPVRVLVPAILLLTIVGSYAVRNNYMDVIFMLASGYLGYVLSNLGFSPGPVVLGLVLGPIAEKGLVQGFLMGNSMFPEHRGSYFYKTNIHSFDSNISNFGSVADLCSS